MASWLDELEERAGPLHAAARAFCTAYGIDWAADGVAAAEALGRAVDAFCHQQEDEDPHQEDRFLEGAGAYLGLLVLHAHGGPGHVSHAGRHRVLLGAHGTFDPFAAIDAALDAEEPLLSLADSLTLAESEAADSGPISSVVAALAAALLRARPDERVARRFELEIELLDGTQIDLRRVAASSSWPRSPSDTLRLARDMERLVDMLPQRRGHAPLEAPSMTPEQARECLTRVLPRPVPVTFARELPEGVALATERLGDDVLLAFVEQHAGRARFLRMDELGHLGGLAVVRAAALRNLRARSERMRFEPLQVGSCTWLAGKSGDGLDAARVVLSEAHARARALLPSAAVAVIPHRDTILFGPAEDAEALTTYARDLMARAPHPISATPLRLPAADAASTLD